MFLTTMAWVLLLPTLTSPKLREEGVSEICWAAARAEKSVIQKDKKTENPRFEPKLFTAYTFSCAPWPGATGDWCCVSPEEGFHEEIRWQRFLIVRDELDRSRLFTAREEKVHGLLCGFQVCMGKETETNDLSAIFCVLQRARTAVYASRSLDGFTISCSGERFSLGPV